MTDPKKAKKIKQVEMTGPGGAKCVPENEVEHWKSRGFTLRDKPAKPEPAKAATKKKA